MKREQAFKRWELCEADLEDITPEKARDLIIKCFYEAQKETFIRARKQIGVRSSDEDIHASVAAGVRQASKETGGDFEKPTKEGLAKVLEVLAKRSASWGTPQDIIEHHKKQIRIILERLK
ncbi:MAG: hypothetical protein EPN94_07895 [Nitrospirae bacterium]|nr:MAG: hypothetical protein EPN94_07895 [Nitrospirota bacterium]